MQKTLSIFLALTAALSLSASAKDLKIPNDDFAVASITLPNSWKPEAIDKGYEAQSPDDAIYLSVVAVGSEKGMNAEIEDTFKFLEEHKVKLDEKSKKEQKFTVNGFEAQELVFDGKDEDGPATISIAFVPIKKKVLIFTYWASKSDEDKHTKEIAKILDSLKAAE